MPLYRQGSRGKEVKQIQRRLKKLGFYNGAVDGIYGPGTEGAVKEFQKEENLQVDGIVGSNPWEALFSKETLKQTLANRCLALTGSFETGEPPPACFSGLAGNFDGQGISLGCLQWNVGQGTLQPLLKEMTEHHPRVMNRVFKDKILELQAVLNSTRTEQMDWARSIQGNNNEVKEPWNKMFRKWGKQHAFQQIQVQAAHPRFDEAVELAGNYDLRSERGVALMFDIKVQNGGISDHTEEQIMQDAGDLPDWSSGEVARMCIIANRRAEASNEQWIEDVRKRKLTIATGRGLVHRIHYAIGKDFNIRLKNIDDEMH